MLSKISQLSEATEKTKTGVKHTAEPGGYGRKDDEDDEGKKVKSDAVKKGRGRPKKNADADTGEEKKYDTKTLGSVFGGGSKPKKEIGKVSKKNKLKEYFDQLDQALNEAEQIQIKPASQVPQKPGQPAMTGQQQASGQAQKNTQVIQQGSKTLGTVDNPQLAQQIKQSIGKGEMTLMPDDQMEEGFGDVAKRVGGAVKKVAGKVIDKLGHGSDEDLIRDLQKKAGVPQTGKKPGEVEEASYSAKAARAGHDIGKPGKNFAKIEKSAGGGEKGKRIAGAVLAKLRGKTNEADIPPNDSTASPLTLEGKQKPDFLDVDKDGNKKESFKKAVSDKKKVKEGMEHRLKAARHAGKSHALGKQSYNCHYDDMEESRMYHEGFKEGLDECYGQMPIQGYVGEVEGSVPAATVPGMANQAEQGGMDEGNAFTAALKRTPTGGKFSVGGKTMTDRSSIEESPFAFESWDSQLNALLEGKEEVAEGMSVSISKGNEGSPDSVSVTAQDGEADQLLSLIKSAGLGLFGGDEVGQPQQGQMGAMSLQPSDSGDEGGAMEIGVVDDHDGMMDLIKKVTGGSVGPQGGEISADDGGYEDEEGESDSEEGHEHEDEHEHTDEETCNECGMMETECGCDDEKEVVDEVESEDQMTYQMAEDNPPDSGAAEEEEEIQDTAQANAAGAAYNPKDDVDESEETEEDQLNEWANEAGKKGTDAAFESDIEFMMNVISGGLNKRKATGQTTIPVVASQLGRQVARETTDINESVGDWKKLAGLK